MDTAVGPSQPGSVMTRPRRATRPRRTTVLGARSHSRLVLRPLIQRFLREGQVVGGVDECDVGEGLREITREALCPRIIFLCKQTDIIAESRKPSDKPARVAGAASH